jgi:tetratricopeptide (TPR) repeat protein
VVLLAVVFLVVSTSCASNSVREIKNVEVRPPSVLLAEAEILYRQRENLLSIRQGINLLKQAAHADPGNYETNWKLARMCYFLGSHTNNDAEADDVFKQGIESGESAVKLNPEKAEGHFWLGGNLGGRARKSIISGLAFVSRIRSEMEAVLKIDESFQSGSAYMVLGQLALEAPKVVGGDAKKAVELLEKGLRFGQSNALLHLELAKAYIAVGRLSEAKQQIKDLKGMAPDPDHLPEHKESLAGAQKILDSGVLN